MIGRGTARVVCGDARSLPLPDASVDLIVTSPPYYGQRSYTDGGQHYDGQIGDEETPREYLAALLDCTREWVRVLKPSGSIFVNLGDKYATRWSSRSEGSGLHNDRDRGSRGAKNTTGVGEKSLLGLPWRYALAVVDDLGLILRRDIVWSKLNGLPESVTDRCRSSHEYLFHLVKRPRYYAAVDEIREPHQPQSVARTQRRYTAPDEFSVSTPNTLSPDQFCHPLGKLPGSVWEIGSQPLVVPEHLGVDHYAAFPSELPRRCILGWSPSGICTECGEGRWPVVQSQRIGTGSIWNQAGRGSLGIAVQRRHDECTARNHLGYACACTPYTDHPERRGKDFHAASGRAVENWHGNGGERYQRYLEELAAPRGPVREYHLDGWNAPPARLSLVVDPFGGTGTTALVASVLGRDAITFDRSADYCRIARWRVSDPRQRDRVAGITRSRPPASPGASAEVLRQHYGWTEEEEAILAGGD